MAPRIIRHEVPPPLRVQPSSSFLDVVFNVTRGRPLPPESPADQEHLPTYLSWGPEHQGRVPRNVLRFRILPGEFPSGEGARPRPIPVASSGEQAELVKQVLRDDDEEAEAVFRPDPECPGNGALQEVLDLNEAVVESFDATEYVEQLRAAIDGLKPGPDKTYRRFFYRFDLHTNPILWQYLEGDVESLDDWDSKLVPDHTEVERAIAATLVRLTDRVTERSNAYPPLPVFETFEDLELPEALEETKLLSKLQKKLYQKLTLAQLGAACARFADGRLRLELPGLAIAIQPSSGFYFFFAEFALLALDNKIDKTTWKNRVDSLVDTQRAFAETYAPPGTPPAERDLDSYHSSNYCGAKAGPAYDDPSLPSAERACVNASAYLGRL